jgi:putative transcriptional regulator
MKREQLVYQRGNRSLAEVAKQLKISPQMLGMIERGERNPSLRLAFQIAAYYQTPVDSIFFDCSARKTGQGGGEPIGKEVT